MACCGNNCDMAKKIGDSVQSSGVYDAAHGTYKPMAPHVTGGAQTVKGGPSPLKFKGGK